MALFYPYCSIMSSVETKNLIPPVNLKGTAEELDNGFFETVGTPLQTASGLMVIWKAL
jgi:hypothetical protein